MYKQHTVCRACRYGMTGPGGIKSAESKESLLPVFDLGIQPLANDFCGPNEEHSGYAPLKVMFCPRCTLAQLSVVVDPEILYRHYNYVTSASDTMMSHFESLRSLFQEEIPAVTLLEIGSNDGRMLQFFKSCGMRICGIDPAENLAELANSVGARTVCGSFDEDSARKARAYYGQFDIVIARHVFCHVNDWRKFIRNLEIVTHKESLVFIEVPYCVDMLQRGEFDTIYHEHTSYMTVRAMGALLKDSQFQIYKIVRFPIHGGAIMLVLSPKESQRTPADTVREFIDSEQITTETWSGFCTKAYHAIDALKMFVEHNVLEKKKVVGFGASAKSTVFVNACRFTKKELRFITDSTAQKQWKLSPGTDIPIVDEGAILRELPDYAVCFAWNFREEILSKNSLARSKGVKFVFPIPTLEVV